MGGSSHLLASGKSFSLCDLHGTLRPFFSPFTGAMPLGGKALKKREQNANAAKGIVTDDAILRKQATAKAEVKCSICMQVFKVTKTCADQKNHAASKHPKQTIADCFPGLEIPA